MSLKAVTLDCAGTLIQVDWRPADLAVECARKVGIEFDDLAASAAYTRLLRSMWSEFQELNTLRDTSVLDDFWRRLTGAWMEDCSMPLASLDAVLAAADDKLFGPESTVFTLYPDTVGCLEELRSHGLRLAVLSNWDRSLHRVLQMHGLTAYFDVAVASLEEGVEKPDPRLFELTLERLGVQPGEAHHVGDDPIDDLLGATQAGLGATLLDRTAAAPGDGRIASLADLPGRLGL